MIRVDVRACDVQAVAEKHVPIVVNRRVARRARESVRVQDEWRKRVVRHGISDGSVRNVERKAGNEDRMDAIRDECSKLGVNYSYLDMRAWRDRG